MVNSIIWHCIHWYFHLLLYTSTWFQYLNLYSQIICFSKKWYVNNRRFKRILYQHAEISSFTVIQCEENVLYILFLWHCDIRSNPAALINFIVILKRTIAQFFNLKIELFPFPNFVIKVKYMHATFNIHQVLYNF